MMYNEWECSNDKWCKEDGIKCVLCAHMCVCWIMLWIWYLMDEILNIFKNFQALLGSMKPSNQKLEKTLKFDPSRPV